jgi:hypothetical protein
MFQEAYRKANAFTRPLVVASRTCSGDIGTGIGAFVVINSEWAITAAHNLAWVVKARADQGAIAAFDAEVADLEANKELNVGARRKKWRQIEQRHQPRQLIRNYLVVFGRLGVGFKELRAFGDADIALVRFQNPLPAGAISEFPTFRKPGSVQPGTGVLKFGYPFYKLAATYNESINSFEFKEDPFPAPVFPIEGIVSRWNNRPDSKEGYPLRWLETSSPGLKGQSGGPIVDQDGAVCAIQVQTKSYDIGFRPTVDTGGKSTTEAQILNAGLGVDVATLEGIFGLVGVTVPWV